MQIDMNACPECGSKKVELGNDGEYCKKCGLIISDVHLLK